LVHGWPNSSSPCRNATTRVLDFVIREFAFADTASKKFVVPPRGTLSGLAGSHLESKAFRRGRSSADAPNLAALRAFLGVIPPGIFSAAQ